MTFTFLDAWQYLWQLSCHVVPRQVYAGIVFQVPVDAHGDVDPRVAPYHYALSLLVQFEEVVVGTFQFHLEFP